MLRRYLSISSRNLSALVMNAKSPAHELWKNAGLPDEFLQHLHLSEQPDPVINSSFKLGSIAQTTIGISGLCAAFIFKARTGRDQSVTVDARHAVIEFKSEAWYLVDNKLPQGDLFDDIAGLYRTKDNSYVRIHTNFPHHKRGILNILQCKPTRESVQEALLEWNAQAFEDEAAAQKMCATKYRSFREWDSHPHAIALKDTQPVQLIKIGDAPKRTLGNSTSYPLEGIRVLDLTRVLAGPICGRTLAAHGADVLHITSQKLPALPLLDKDTSRGKRNTQLDLTDSNDRNILADLCKDADVFLQGYRPGGLDEKGFGPQDLARRRPGIVYASLNAYGWDGPWKDRRGFDSLVQNATGFGYAEASAYRQYNEDPAAELTPKPLPCQAIDHASGYLLAFGVMTAIVKSITEGGSWEVRVSLAAVAQWMRSFGLLDAQTAFGKGPEYPQRTAPQAPELQKLSTEIVGVQLSTDGQSDETKRSRITAIKHAARLSVTPVKESEAPLELDTHKPSWLPRLEN